MLRKQFCFNWEPQSTLKGKIKTQTCLCCTTLAHGIVVMSLSGAEARYSKGIVHVCMYIIVLLERYYHTQSDECMNFSLTDTAE